MKALDHSSAPRRTRPRRSVPALALACLALGAAVLAAGACGGPEAGDFTPRTSEAAAREPSASAVRVIFLGDSLTAGVGLAQGETYPALIENRLLDDGHDVEVINAGVSGDTTAGGLSRLDWLLDQDPDLVVVGLGANDALRGQDLAETEENLRTIVRRIRQTGARTLLLGMKIPPSHGLDYAGRFEEIYPRIARDLGVPLVPFLLEDVAADPSLNLPDRIHPNARGHRQLAANVYPYVEDLLD